jgi:hypothetical protein
MAAAIKGKKRMGSDLFDDEILVNYNDDFKKLLKEEEMVARTTYNDYVDRIEEKKITKGNPPPFSNTKMYGKSPNEIKVEYVCAKDPNKFADELATFIYKEAELIQYDEEMAAESAWTKLARGILNPLS